MYSNVTELGILKGPEVGNFDLQYPKMENNYEEQSWTKDAQNNEVNNMHPWFVVDRCLKEVMGLVPKTDFFFRKTAQ